MNRAPTEDAAFAALLLTEPVYAHHDTLEEGNI